MRKIAIWILGCIALMAIVGPHLTPYAYDEIHLNWNNLPPCPKFWFGTDELGRDLFTRIWWGARISLFVGVAAALIDMAIGILWGSLSAMTGGKVDETMCRICDILYAIPYLLVVILLTVIRGSGIGTILIAMTCTGWINMARIVRGQMLQLKESDYVTAARLYGASGTRILFRHLLPNAMAPIMTAMALTIPTAIFTESFLSFLGLGVQLPAASWGVMISDSLSAMRYYPWRLLFPSCMLTLTILTFNMLTHDFES